MANKTITLVEPKPRDSGDINIHIRISHDEEGKRRYHLGGTHETSGNAPNDSVDQISIDGLPPAVKKQIEDFAEDVAIPLLVKGWGYK